MQRLRLSLDELEAPRPVRVVCGFSGGADSLALLAGLRALDRAGAIDMRAVHVDHGVRPGSAAEARRAIEVAGSLGVTCDVVILPPGAVERHHGVGIEEALRRERYRAFAEVVERVGGCAVALGHHQRDQAETVLLHLLRGAGIRGASGMRAVTELTVPWWRDSTSARKLRVWRPFLSEPAESVRAFAESLGLPFVEDESNADLALRRNAIRHRALPLLEGIVPGAVSSLARFAALAGVDSDELDDQARFALDGMESAGSLPAERVFSLPLALRQRVVQLWCRRQAGDIEVGLDRIEAILRVAAVKERERRVEIGGGWSVVMATGELRMVPSPAPKDG